MNHPIRASLVTLLLFLVTACSGHPKRMDCESHLRPINSPAPMKSSGLAQP
jgi:hypothetical protein